MGFIGNRLTCLYIGIANGIGKSKKESNPFRIVAHAFGKCKSDMEDLMFSQYSVDSKLISKAEGASTGIFYNNRVPLNPPYYEKVGTKLSISEYIQIRNEILFLQNSLFTLYIAVLKGLGKSKKESVQLQRILTAFDKCADNLNLFMISQYPLLAEAIPGIFCSYSDISPDLQRI